MLTVSPETLKPDALGVSDMRLMIGSLVLLLPVSVSAQDAVPKQTEVDVTIDRGFKAML